MKKLVLCVTFSFVLIFSGVDPVLGETSYLRLYSNIVNDECLYYPGAIGIARDSNGVVWFADTNGSLVKVILNDEHADWKAYQIPTEGDETEIWNIAFDSAGNVWFADVVGNLLWVFDPSDEQFVSYELPAPDAYPLQLLVDQDGDIWLSELYASSLARFTPSSETFVEFRTPTPSSGPSGLCLDREGYLWLTEEFAGQIARFNPKTGIFEEFSFDPPLLYPRGIAVDQEGVVWFTQIRTSHFCKFIREERSLTVYPTSFIPYYAEVSGKYVKVEVAAPYWLYIDSKGDILFNEKEAGKIARFNPSTKTLVEYVLPPSAIDPSQLEDIELPKCCQGLSGSVSLGFGLDQWDNGWFTEFLGTQIGYVDTSSPPQVSIQPSTREVELAVGQSTTITIDLVLSDNTPYLQDVSLNITSSEQPSGELDKLSASLSPDFLSEIVKGEPARVTLNLATKPSIVAGEYVLAFSCAGPSATYSTMIEINVVSSQPQDDEVTADYTLLYLGVGVAAVVVITLCVIFWRRHRSLEKKRSI